MLVVSEFVGCSPSVSGALRVNPWSINSVADGIYSAIKMPLADRHLRHDKHWRYVSQHTAKFWAQARRARAAAHACLRHKRRAWVLPSSSTSSGVLDLRASVKTISKGVPMLKRSVKVCCRMWSAMHGAASQWQLQQPGERAEQPRGSGGAPSGAESSGSRAARR